MKGDGKTHYMNFCVVTLNASGSHQLSEIQSRTLQLDRGGSWLSAAESRVYVDELGSHLLATKDLDAKCNSPFDKSRILMQKT
jgi:hypothetical protein